MEKEISKAYNSLKIFSELAILFEDCEFRGLSSWRETAKNSIKIIKNLNIKETYFNESVEEAKNNLKEILPLNKNKNKKRIYKKISN